MRIQRRPITAGIFVDRRLLDPRIKLRHIVCFLEVTRLKSVMKAANALGITQPAASKTIQELELVLGVPLFDRSRRNLFLTPFGEIFSAMPAPASPRFARASTRSAGRGPTRSSSG